MMMRSMRSFRERVRDARVEAPKKEYQSALVSTYAMMMMMMMMMERDTSVFK